MPLYEVILISKIGSSANMANMIKSLTSKVIEEGGCVRNVTNLGDRILNRAKVKTIDRTKAKVMRYIAMQVDANPDLKNKLLVSALGHGDCIKAFATKMKEETYIKEAQRRLLQQTSPFTQEENKDAEVVKDLYKYIEEYTQMKKELRNPKEHYLKNKDKFTGEFWDKSKRMEQYAKFARGEADKLDDFK